MLQSLGIGRLTTVAAEPPVRAGRRVPVLEAVVDRQPVPLHAVMAGGRQRLPKLWACVDCWVGWSEGIDAA